MKYEVSREGSITCGSRVVLRHPEHASANMIVEALQDAADRAYKEAIEDVCQEAHGLLDNAPADNRPAVMQRSSNHGRRVGE